MINLRSEVSQALNQIANVKVWNAFPKEFKSIPCIAYQEIDNIPTRQSSEGEVSSLIQFNVHVFASTQSEADQLSMDVDEKMTALGFYREGKNQQTEELKHIILRYSCEIDVLTNEKFKF